MVSWVGVHSPNTGWTWPSTRPRSTALPPASSTASARASGGGSSAAMVAPSISNDVTAACGRSMSPVKNSPMFLMSSVATARLYRPVHRPPPSFRGADCASMLIRGRRLLERRLLLLRRLFLVLGLPLLERLAVDDLSALVPGHRNALGVGGVLHPVRQAIAAEAGEIHHVDVLHVGAATQMLDQALVDGGLE